LGELRKTSPDRRLLRDIETVYLVQLTHAITYKGQLHLGSESQCPAPVWPRRMRCLCDALPIKPPYFFGSLQCRELVLIMAKHQKVVVEEGKVVVRL
jgi:hypothetical protein